MTIRNWSESQTRKDFLFYLPPYFFHMQILERSNYHALSNPGIWSPPFDSWSSSHLQPLFQPAHQLISCLSSPLFIFFTLSFSSHLSSWSCFVFFVQQYPTSVHSQTVQCGWTVPGVHISPPQNGICFCTGLIISPSIAILVCFFLSRLENKERAYRFRSSKLRRKHIFLYDYRLNIFKEGMQELG